MVLVVNLLFLGYIIFSLSQLNCSLTALSYGIPKIMPSLDSLVILNFILKSYLSIFTATFLVSRYAFLSLYIGSIPSTILSLIGFSFFLYRIPSCLTTPRYIRLILAPISITAFVFPSQKQTVVRITSLLLTKEIYASGINGSLTSVGLRGFPKGSPQGITSLVGLLQG